MKSISVNNKSFTLINLLGKGKGGYSYLVTDREREYVVKQIHHEPCDYYKFGDKLESELRDYKRLSEIGISLPKLLDTDRIEERIFKEYIPGKTIAEIITEGEMRQSYLEQIKQWCGLLYAANTNIDYFPTNFVVNNGSLFYIDYECNDYMEEWDFEHWGIKYWENKFSDNPVRPP